jgi:hypothetical protein
MKMQSNNNSLIYYVHAVEAKKHIQYLLIDDTLGTDVSSQILSSINRSRISHANIVGLFSLSRNTDSTTDCVTTFGFEPPIKPGFMDPVS